LTVAILPAPYKRIDNEEQSRTSDELLQDVLNQLSDARTNLPGRADGNWGRRCTADMLSGPVYPVCEPSIVEEFNASFQLTEVTQ
jgi:hypothetical protein